MTAMKLLWIGLLLSSALALHAEDVVRLRNGRIIKGAVVRQDTSAVYITPWEQRLLRQPEFEVFTRDEVESIWFIAPPEGARTFSFSPHSGMFEIAGGVTFQTWASSIQHRRYLAQASLLAGYMITKHIGFELNADITAPYAQKSDTLYDPYRFGHQMTLRVIGTMDLKLPFVPYAFVGGGSSVAVPEAGSVRTTSEDVHSVFDAGAGVKIAANGFGVRFELRHCFYDWNREVVPYSPIEPDTVVGYDTQRENADATSFRVFLFTYF